MAGNDKTPKNDPSPENAAALTVAAAEEAFLGAGESPSRVFVCSIYEDQRPLKGIAGALDWRLKGFLSRFVLGGRISGTRNEFVYVPVRHREAMRHLLLVGLGSSSDSQSASPKEHGELLSQLAKTISNLKFGTVALSRSSFPFLEETQIRKALKGVDVEFTR